MNKFEIDPLAYEFMDSLIETNLNDYEARLVERFFLSDDEYSERILEIINHKSQKFDKRFNRSRNLKNIPCENNAFARFGYDIIQIYKSELEKVLYYHLSKSNYFSYISGIWNSFNSLSMLNDSNPNDYFLIELVEKHFGEKFANIVSFNQKLEEKRKESYSKQQRDIAKKIKKLKKDFPGTEACKEKVRFYTEAFNISEKRAIKYASKDYFRFYPVHINRDDSDFKKTYQRFLTDFSMAVVEYCENFFNYAHFQAATSTCNHMLMASHFKVESLKRVYRRKKQST